MSKLIFSSELFYLDSIFSYFFNYLNKDIVITADSPLADLIVKKGALAMNPRGKVYTKETIKEALSIRNFMAQVRESGIVTGGPKPFSNKDKHHFAAALDQILTDRMN